MIINDRNMAQTIKPRESKKEEKFSPENPDVIILGNIDKSNDYGPMIQGKVNFRPIDENLFSHVSEKSDDAKDDTGTEKTEEKSVSLFTDLDMKAAQPLPQMKDWTVMTYFNGNCDLQSDMEQSLQALENAGSDQHINFVAQIAYGDKGGEAKRIFLKKPGWMGMKKNSEVMAKLPETNMAHPQTLKDFLSWGMKTFPAKHYMVILNGHGMGFIGSLPDDKSNDILLTPELKSAVDTATKESGQKIDILGFDSCLMANAETAHALKDSVNFLVGSEEVLISGNWQYEELASKLKEDADTGDGLTTAKALEEMMKSQQNNMLLTTSIIDCRKMPGFSDKLKAFSEKLLATDSPPANIKSAFRRAQHYCQPKILSSASNGSVNTKPMNQMRDVASVAMEVIASDSITDTGLKDAALDLAKFVKKELIIFEMHRKGMDISNSSGISVYAPASEADKYADYYQGKISLSQDTHWGEVVKKFGLSG